jgi:sugar transferase (PEP-CTERM system associated)
MILLLHRYTSLRSVLLMATEGVLVVLCLVSGAKLRFWSEPEAFLAYVASSRFVFQALTVLVVVQMCLYYNDLYKLSERISRREEVIRLGQSLGAAGFLLGMLYYVFPGLLIGRGVLMIAAALLLAAVSVTRFGFEWIWQFTVRKRRVAIVGHGALSAAIINVMSQRDDLGVELAGTVATMESDPPGLGHIGNLLDIVREHNISRIIVALEDSSGALPVGDLVHLRVQGVEIDDAQTALAGLTGRVWIDAVRPTGFVFSGAFERSYGTIVVKRMVDLVSGVVGLILFAPVMAAIAVAIRLNSKGPVLYRQTRVGLADKPYELLKFRSMRADAEAENGAQWAAEADPRVTRVGRLLRIYRLDELPQFLNVLRGEMSLVGPRPERPIFVEQLRKEIPFYDNRHSVRPGMTGWAQVEYKYGSTVQDAYHKLEYDLFYLKNLSIVFDVVIIIRTVGIVLFGAGR